MLIRILLILFGYVFGLFQTGWFYGKHVGVNLKESGSGNTGATNALRVLGVKAGLVVLVFDALKAAVPCLLVHFFMPADGSALRTAYVLYAGLGAILGNNYPFFLKFNGGKGVAALLGVVLAVDYQAALLLLALFFILAFVTRYVSLASVTCCLLLMGYAFLYNRMNYAPACWTDRTIEVLVLMMLIPGLVIFRHSANIKRLFNGTENRFGKRKK